MSEERDPSAPSLEPPSLFGRKRRKASSKPVQKVERVEPAEPVEPLVPVESVTVERAAPVEPPARVVASGPVESSAVADPDTIFDDTSVPTRSAAPDASALTPPPAPEAPEEPGPPREPWLTARPAAAATGLVVGGLIVAATAGSQRLCTAVKGTSSCGDQGFFLLVAILAAAVLLGAALLRLAQVAEPGSTSFLAVGLLSVATLLFLVGSIFQWWMIIVIPLVSVSTFLLSHWVATTYIDPMS
jgi:hypothetical protein